MYSVVLIYGARRHRVGPQAIVWLKKRVFWAVLEWYAGKVQISLYEIENNVPGARKVRFHFPSEKSLEFGRKVRQDHLLSCLRIRTHCGFCIMGRKLQVVFLGSTPLTPYAHAPEVMVGASALPDHLYIGRYFFQIPLIVILQSWSRGCTFLFLRSWCLFVVWFFFFFFWASIG